MNGEGEAQSVSLCEQGPWKRQEEGTSEGQEQAQPVGVGTTRRLDQSVRGDEGEDKPRGHGAMVVNSDLTLSAVGALEGLEQLGVLTDLHFHGITLASE